VQIWKRGAIHACVVTCLEKGLEAFKDYHVDYRKSEFDSLPSLPSFFRLSILKVHISMRVICVARCVITQRYDNPMMITTAMHVTGLTKEARLAITQISINFNIPLTHYAKYSFLKYVQRTNLHVHEPRPRIEMPELKSRLRVYTDSLIASWTQTRRPRLRRSDPSKRTDRATAGSRTTHPRWSSSRVASNRKSPRVADNSDICY